jgi:alanyl-tRNA synthetase
VQATGEIGLFKIVGESAVAAGVRRIEAVTAANAEQYLLGQLEELNEIRNLLKGAQHPVKAVAALQEEVRLLKKQVELLVNEQAGALKSQLKSQFQEVKGIKFLSAKLPIQDANAVKTLAFQLETEVGNCCIVFGLESDGKPQIMVAVSRELTEAGPKLHAGNMVRELAKEIQGGGKDASGLERAIAKAKELI